MTDLMTNDTPTFSTGVCAPGPQDKDWRDEGLCAQTDPEAFFPEKGGSTREAKRICHGCPVRHECLWTALETRDRFGIWGGWSERERRQLLRLLPAITAAQPDADAISWLRHRTFFTSVDDSIVANWLATPALLARLTGGAPAANPLGDVIDIDAHLDEQSAPDIDDDFGTDDDDLDLTERLAS